MPAQSSAARSALPFVQLVLLAPSDAPLRPDVACTPPRIRTAVTEGHRNVPNWAVQRSSGKVCFLRHDRQLRVDSAVERPLSRRDRKVALRPIALVARRAFRDPLLPSYAKKAALCGLRCAACGSHVASAQAGPQPARTSRSAAGGRKPSPSWFSHRAIVGWLLGVALVILFRLCADDGRQRLDHWRPASRDARNMLMCKECRERESNSHGVATAGF
jgi:hypothetical protein